MLNGKKLLSMAAAVVVMAVISSASHAAPIAVSNFSFENPDLGGGGFNNDVTDWIDEGANGNSFVEVLGGGSFATDGTQHVGLQNNNGIYQDTGVANQAGTYTLTVDYGNRAGGFSAENDGVAESLIQLWVGDPTAGGLLQVEGAFDSGLLADGAFTGVAEIVFDSTGGPAGNIFIRLADNDPGGNRAHFDNVRLDFVSVPEPATAGLLALGAAGLLRRRRKMA